MLLRRCTSPCASHLMHSSMPIGPTLCKSSMPMMCACNSFPAPCYFALQPMVMSALYRAASVIPLLAVRTKSWPRTCARMKAKQLWTNQGALPHQGINLPSVCYEYEYSEKDRTRVAEQDCSSEELFRGCATRTTLTTKQYRLAT